MADPNWLTRSRGANGRRIVRGPNDPWPLFEQTALPSEHTVHLLEPGTTIGHDRGEHPADDQNGIGAKARSLMARIFAKIGLHSQVLTNFRADVGLADQTLVPYNPMRSYLFVLNTGAASVFLAFDRVADANTGILIPAGGFYEPILGTVSSVHVIGNAAAQEVRVVEGFYTWPGVGS